MKDLDPSVVAGGVLSLMGTALVAWFGLIKDRGTKPDPVMLKTISNYEELCEIQEKMLETKDRILALQEKELAVLRVEADRLRPENTHGGAS